VKPDLWEPHVFEVELRLQGCLGPLPRDLGAAGWWGRAGLKGEGVSSDLRCLDLPPSPSHTCPTGSPSATFFSIILWRAFCTCETVWVRPGTLPSLGHQALKAAGELGLEGPQPLLPKSLLASHSPWTLLTSPL
jgi:hypothetical protein